MRLLVSVLILAIAAAAQTPAPGVITVTQTSSIAATAGGLRCTVSTTTKGASVSVYCYVGSTLAFNATVVVFAVSPQTNGAATHYTYNGDRITGLFWRPLAGDPVRWQVAANDVMKEGTF